MIIGVKPGRAGSADNVSRASSMIAEGLSKESASTVIEPFSNVTFPFFTIICWACWVPSLTVYFSARSKMAMSARVLVFSGTRLVVPSRGTQLFLFVKVPLGGVGGGKLAGFHSNLVVGVSGVPGGGLATGPVTQRPVPVSSSALKTTCPLLLNQ